MSKLYPNPTWKLVHVYVQRIHEDKQRMRIHVSGWEGHRCLSSGQSRGCYVPIPPHLRESLISSPRKHAFFILTAIVNIGAEHYRQLEPHDWGTFTQVKYGPPGIEC